MMWYDSSDTVPGPFLQERNPYEEKPPEDEENEEKRGVLQFADYEAYLDDLVLEEDVVRLESYTAARMIVALGARHTGVTLTMPKLLKLQAKKRENLKPRRRKYELASENYYDNQGNRKIVPKSKSSRQHEDSLLTSLPGSSPRRSGREDALMRELAIREKSNRMGVLATIILIRKFNAHGHEISGYIDYEERLEMEKWEHYFEGSKLLVPRPGDLAYVHWKHGTASWKPSRNFRVILDPVRGMIFQHRHDRKIMITDPKAESFGCGSTRVTVNDSNYEQVVLYDHLVRKKL
ncbi:cilia- and flagella-associated protein 299-like [Ischnura elegans]|uniref:cilia- and flagella-associated protein 299-like n=1 Tax=Ischnura elegans TaxID=197161 RepID=UPI001ED87E80|nr:cilia- and flagella-associated protein 299-like [Ischnura elegans]